MITFWDDKFDGLQYKKLLLLQCTLVCISIPYLE